MYAKYVSLTTSVQAQVINDLALLLSGSPISALSTSCDKVNTTLLSTVAPGWTLVDSVAPSSGCVISAPDIDNVTTKFVDFYAQAVNTIGLYGYETWNATTHTGTNQVVGTTNMAYSSSVANTYALFCTPRSFYICPINGYGLGSFEFTRDCQYLIGTVYPCFAIINSTSLNPTSYSAVSTLCQVPRMKNLSGTGDITGITSGIQPSSLGLRHNAVTGATTRAPESFLTDASGVRYHELRPLWFLSGVGSSVAFPAIIGKAYDVLEISAAAGNTLDTFSDGVTTYVIANISGYAYAFKMA